MNDLFLKFDATQNYLIMNKLAIFMALIVFTINASAQNEWSVDSYHSSVNFAIKHSNISMVNGKFLEYSGTMNNKGEIENLENVNFEFTIQAKSIDTSVEARDNHLRSADFFDVDKFPTINFKSTKVMKTGKPNHYLLHGKMTIKGVTKDVIFDLYYGGLASSDDGQKIGLKAKTVINRFDYNINFDPSGMGIGKEVQIITHLQFVKQ